MFCFAQARFAKPTYERPEKRENVIARESRRIPTYLGVKVHLSFFSFFSSQGSEFRNDYVIRRRKCYVECAIFESEPRIS